MLIPRAYVICLMMLLLPVAIISIADSRNEIKKPYQLDYGEGIVLYQASTILNLSSAYKPIEQYPYVIFHYPPVYHLAVIAVQRWTGDLLLAGRIVSLISGILIQVIFGLMVFFCLPRRLDPFYRYGAALFSALLPDFLYVMNWSRLARVDTLAILLSSTGAALIVLSGKNRLMQYCAFVLFVAAVFTKQTMIAAPLASFIVLFVIDAKNALKVGLFAGVLGCAVLTALSWATHGQIIKHLFVYNQNSFDFHQLVSMLTDNYFKTMPVFVLAIGAAGAAAIEAWNFVQRGRWQIIRSRLEYSPTRRLIAVFSLLLAFAFLISFTAGKVGANYNYFMEWNLALCPLAGISLCRILGQLRKRPRWSPVNIILLMVPMIIVLPSFPYSMRQLIQLARSRGERQFVVEKTPGYQDFTQALEIVRESKGPVFSEDMWLLVKSGKQVPAEPAIIRELARTSQWNEQPFVRMIKEKRFSTIVITSELENSERFTPAVADAIGVAYHITRQIGRNYKIYEPRSN